VIAALKTLRAQPDKVRVVHLGRSACHAISGRGISQLAIPSAPPLITYPEHSLVEARQGLPLFLWGYNPV